MINEYLIEYSHMNKNILSNNLSNVYNYLTEHSINDIELIEYYDSTEYFNLSTYNTNLAETSGNINNKFWIDNYENISQDIEKAFTNAEISDYYLNTVGINDKIKTKEELSNFLSIVYNLGAHDSFINENNIFHCQLSDKQYTYDLYPHLVGLSSNYREFYNYLLSAGDFTFPDDILANQISSVMNHIYTWLSNTYITDISSIYFDHKSKLETLSSDYKSISELFQNTISSTQYNVYFNKSNNRFCYINNDISSIDKQIFKLDYSNRFFIDNFLIPPYWQDNEYNKYLIERINKLNQFVNEKKYIVNYPLSIEVDYLHENLLSLFNNLYDNVVNPLIESYDFSDPAYPLLKTECDNILLFLDTSINNKRATLLSELQTKIDDAFESANEFNQSYNAYKIAAKGTITASNNPAPDMPMGKIPQYFYRTKKLEQDKDIDGKTQYIGKYTMKDKISVFGEDKEPDNLDNPEVYYDSHKTSNIKAGHKKYVYIWYGDDVSGGNKTFYEEMDLYDASNYIDGTTVPELPDGIDASDSLEITDDDSAEIAIKKCIAWLKQITFVSYNTKSNLLENPIQGFYNESSIQELQIQLNNLIDNQEDILETYETLLSNINELSDIGFESAPAFSDSIPVAIQQILAYLSDCRDSINDIINSNIDISCWNDYKNKTNIIMSKNNNFVDYYNQIPTDNEQTLYLSKYTWQQNYTIANLELLLRYIKNTDKENNNTLSIFIKDLYEKYDTLMNDYYNISEEINNQLRETTYKYDNTYFESGISSLIDTINYEIQQRLLHAYEKINEQKISVDSYMYNNDYSIEYEINQKYDLLINHENMISAIDNRLSDINFFNFDYYKEQINFYNTYAYNVSSYNPYFVHKNKTHPSYQVHPYLYNFIESRVIDQFVLQTFDNGLILELEESAIENNINNFIGQCGQTINTWLNNARDYSGYKSRYETSYHQIEVNNKTRIHEIIDYDGAFFPPAIEQLLTNYDKCVEQVYNGNLSDDTSFYKKYYEHLELNDVQRKYIANQLIHYKDLITDITQPRSEYTDFDGVYDIYKYTIDQYNTSYILYKRYSNENTSYEDKLNTTGQLWTRYENHPIAFPAFYGDYPNFELNSVYANTMIDDLKKLNTKLYMSYFYDMQFDDSSQLLALMAETTQNIDNKKFENSDIYFGHIKQYELSDSRSCYIFSDNDLTIHGKNIRYFSKINYNDRLKLIGYSQSDRNELTFIYINRLEQLTNLNHTLQVTFKKRIKNYENSQFEFSNDFTTTFNVSPIPGYYFYNDNIVVSYDRINNTYSFATIIKKLSTNNNILSIITPNYSVFPDYPENTKNPISDENNISEHNSFDSIPFIMTFKFNCTNNVVTDINILNLNADSSYDPLYPGEIGAVKDNDNKQYLNIELLGYSKNIDSEISSINKSSDPYFNINKIINNYTFGRVYENYDKLDDKSILVNYNNLLVKKAGQEYPIWTIDVSKLNDNVYDVILFNTFTYGKNPYYIGNTIELSSGWIDCYYMYNIDNNAEVQIYNDINITIGGTYNYFSGKQNLLDSNKIHNVKNIKITYDNDSKHINVYFEAEDITKDSYITKDSIQIVVLNQYDIQIFKYYHLLDAFGIVNTKYSNINNISGYYVSVPVPNSSYYDRSKTHIYIQFYDNNAYLKTDKYDIETYNPNNIVLPQKDGYHYVIPSDVDFSKKIDINVYGKYEINTYTVKIIYSTNAQNNKTIIKNNIIYGTDIRSQLPYTVKTGYIFDKWEITHGKIEYIGYQNIPNNTLITIESKYNPITYTIRFTNNVDDTSYEMICVYDNTYTLLPNRFNSVDSNFIIFDCWKASNGKIYKDCASIINLTTINNDIIVLEAQWKYLEDKVTQSLIFDTDKSLNVDFTLGNKNTNVILYTDK